MHQAWTVRTALFPALAAATMAATATLSATGGTALGAITPSSATSAVTASAPQIAVYPDAIILPHAPMAAPPTDSDCQAADRLDCYTPGDLRNAYDLPALYARGATGKGETIMIVDAFGSPTIKHDLAGHRPAGHRGRRHRA